jgi:hypothetical protein
MRRLLANGVNQWATNQKRSLHHHTNPGSCYPEPAVTNRQVPHSRPTRVDNRLSSVIVPVEGLLNTSDIAR